MYYNIQILIRAYTIITIANLLICTVMTNMFLHLLNKFTRRSKERNRKPSKKCEHDQFSRPNPVFQVTSKFAEGRPKDDWIATA